MRRPKADPGPTSRAGADAPVRRQARPKGGSRGVDASLRPYTLVAELTHRCPLHCPYCSNPIELATAPELGTAEWLRAFEEAAALGVLQVHLTGGEPLVRDDLVPLVDGARRAGLYVNLITSGVPLDAERFRTLVDAGLDHVQLSFQDVDPAAADRIAGRPAHERKLAVVALVRDAGLPLTVNVVVHRANIDRVDALIAFAESTGASRLELANAQYLGWGLKNRAFLLPSSEQLDRARRAVAAARARLGGKLEIAFVLPDYHAGLPRPCMDGWARRFMVIAPDGKVLPCHAASSLPIEFDDVRSAPLASIWETSPGLLRFRGEDWMAEPCRSCDRRGVDFGGCRCQAYHLAGDAAAADPACKLSPHHALVEAERARADAAVPDVNEAFVPRAALNRR